MTLRRGPTVFGNDIKNSKLQLKVGEFRQMQTNALFRIAFSSLLLSKSVNVWNIQYRDISSCLLRVKPWSLTVREEHG